MSRSKKLTQKEIYFNRERKLNQMINKFARLTFRGNLNDLDSYDAMNRMRLEIKRIFDIISFCVNSFFELGIPRLVECPQDVSFV